jgi:hypothetical protein
VRKRLVDRAPGCLGVVMTDASSPRAGSGPRAHVLGRGADAPRPLTLRLEGR